MLHEDPPKCKAWRAEFLALVLAIMHDNTIYKARKKNKNNTVQSSIRDK